MNTSYNLELNPKPNIDKRSTILLRITQNRKHKRLSTGISVFAEDFNKKAEYGKWIRRTDKNYTKLNTDLEKKINEAKEQQSEIETTKKIATSANIIQAIKLDMNSESFLEFWEGKLKQYLNTKSYNYYKTCNSKLTKLKEYLNDKDLLFYEVDVEFLNKYESYMYGKELTKNTVFANLKIIRSIVFEAIKEGKFKTVNPFQIKKLEEGKPNKIRLTIDQIKAIEKLELEEDSILYHVRNYFLFSFYCAGIRVSDFIQLKHGNIEGNKLFYTMDKSEHSHNIQLTTKALNILKLYTKPKQKHTDFIFPLLTNNVDYSDKKYFNNQIGSKTAIINKALKDLASLAKINSNLTFHISRHSYADILRQKKVSVYDIKNLLGHSDIKITQKYLAGFDNNASNDVHSGIMENL